MKTCSKCKVGFAATAEFFQRDASRKDGLYPRCKVCTQKGKRESDQRLKTKNKEEFLERRRRYVKTYKIKHPDKTKHSDRNTRLKRKFGITTVDYDQMLAAQNGSCAICKQQPTSTLHVDHDHNTGRLRKLLCSRCNLGLGIFNDDVELFATAILYVEAHRCAE